MNRVHPPQIAPTTEDIPVIRLELRYITASCTDGTDGLEARSDGAITNRRCSPLFRR
jgi:hypothetical protein